MKVLVIGGGGREHAIVKALSKNKNIKKIYCAPSNAGINTIASAVPIGVMEFDKIADFLDNNKDIVLTVVAPDNPLVGGLVDFLEQRNHRVFGPNSRAAIIEGSKVFAKNLMIDNNIPTAGFSSFTDYNKALNYLQSASYPTVVKVDGLAYGKGVIICQNIEEAIIALDDIMLNGAFGKGNTAVVIEDFLVGREISLLAFTDGKTVIPMVSSQDHKKAFDGDKGANTGGMGAFAPSPYYTDELAKKTMDTIILPTINAMNAMGRKFKGVLYFGLMVCDNQPFLLEYNARFGDPEAQVVLELLKTDLFEIMQAIIDERLSDIDIIWDSGVALTTVLASGGYPAEYPVGKAIAIGDIADDVVIYHAGTTLSQGKLQTSGGRVMAVTAKAKDMASARQKVYQAIDKISFEGMFFRKDIGVL